MTNPTIQNQRGIGYRLLVDEYARTLVDLGVGDARIGPWLAREFHAEDGGKRYRFRSEGFSGWLAVTNRRVICSTFSKRQINIAVDDPKTIG